MELRHSSSAVDGAVQALHNVDENFRETLERWKSGTDASLQQLDDMVAHNAAQLESKRAYIYRRHLRLTSRLAPDMKTPVLQEITDLKAENRLFFQEMLHMQSKYEELLNKFGDLMQESVAAPGTRRRTRAPLVLTAAAAAAPPERAPASLASLDQLILPPPFRNKTPSLDTARNNASS